MHPDDFSLETGLRFLKEKKSQTRREQVCVCGGGLITVIGS